jgi:hypothetical protein
VRAEPTLLLPTQSVNSDYSKHRVPAVYFLIRWRVSARPTRGPEYDGREKKGEPPDLHLYAVNRRRFPAEQLAPYYGKFVAWSPDGTRIVASGKQREDVWKQLEAAGLDPSQFVNDYINPPGEAPYA